MPRDSFVIWRIAVYVTALGTGQSLLLVSFVGFFDGFKPAARRESVLHSDGILSGRVPAALRFTDEVSEFAVDSFLAESQLKEMSCPCRSFWNLRFVERLNETRVSRIGSNCTNNSLRFCRAQWHR